MYLYESSSHKEKAGENNEKVTEENRKNAKDNSVKQTSKKNIVSIFTDKYNYEKGEVVKMIVKNRGTRLTLSDSDIEIRNLKTDRSFLLPSSVPEKFTLDSGASKNIQIESGRRGRRTGEFRQVSCFRIYWIIR